jgi:hypothetical protein
MNSPDVIREKWNKLNEKVHSLSGRKINIVAVTKYYPPEIYKFCIDAGILEIGENRIQELIDKNKVMSEERKKLKIHFIGSLQTNKVRFLSGNADYLDTVSSAVTVKKINERWETQGESLKKLPLLLQINCTDEIQKAGLHINNFKEILELGKLCVNGTKTRLEGIMTMGPTPEGDYDFPEKKYIDDTKKAFLKAGEIKSRLENELGMELPRLSMGMSHDYELAIECGSTEIRVGSLLFGPV